MNYKASGTLLGFAPVREELSLFEGDRFVVFVERGPESYVVSHYIDGWDSWLQGHYFSSYHEAHAYFVTEVLETLGVTALDKPKKLPGLVKKLGDFLERIEAAV